MTEFKKLGVSEKLADAIREMRIEIPSEIQKRTIPLILEGHDVIGNAATGSGKTLAFASGIIETVKPGEGIQALVLTPTRELADQIAKVTKIFAKHTDLKIQEIYGGVGFSDQIEGSKKSEIIIGTPGRILDHLEKRNFDFFNLKILVLDEADRMVDMGFLPDVEKIIRQCPIKRQTLLFSATTSPDIAYIEEKYMRSPKHIVVEQYVDASKLRQYYYDVPNHLKFSLLVHLLKQESSGIVMVFCNTRRNVDLVAQNLKRYGISAQAIHGGLEQNKRNRIMEQFHKNKADILVCTDVAARGLDIKDVTHVYNYDSPKTSEEYIHRIGRTARAGKEGMAVTLISSRDYDNFRKVTLDTSLKIERKDLPKIEQLGADFGQNRQRGRDSHKRNNSRGPTRQRDRRTGGFRNSSPRGRSQSRYGDRPRGKSFGDRPKSQDRNRQRDRRTGSFKNTHSKGSRSPRDHRNSGNSRNPRGSNRNRPHSRPRRR